MDDTLTCLGQIKRILPAKGRHIVRTGSVEPPTSGTRSSPAAYQECRFEPACEV